ncbi:1-aminocyclopropane-1-carboxylate synthase-like [Camellia sinensis]|uniref:1-aminocyclopropane-1-carboxylate synthase-like n=1 Tax=Camellia sinensis TaxID=4442 RepID=UPI001035FCAD|nr:1-aminocyclopropane-1-carboxylate synthase-like [Camellia sinensis]
MSSNFGASQVSFQTQYLLASMLSDDDFVGRFLNESSRRLECRHKIFTKGLKEMGIDCLNTNAGLFYWMDLYLLLKEPTIEAKMALWRVIINDVKLNVSSGSSFHCTEVGWFRVCFANIDDDTIEISLQRIRTFVTKKKEGEVAIVKKKRWQMNLRLSFSSRIYNDGLRSPLRG